MFYSIQRIILAIGFALVAGCNTTSGDNLFRMQPSDASITSAVHESFVKDKNLSALKIHVATTNGVVMLSGRARTIRQSDEAAALAAQSAGVKSVQNKIIVRR